VESGWSGQRRVLTVASSSFIKMPDLVPTVQAFAISPREDQMAFLKASEIAFYQVQVGE